MNTHVTRQLAEAAAREDDVVRLADVRRRFGATAALDGVSLTVRRGEILGIIGRSGAGKSTLIRCLNGLERPDSGSIAIEGREITGLGEAELQPLRRRIGMIFQHFNLLSAKTVEENVALPLKIEGWTKAKRLARAAELIDLVGLKGKAKAYPSELSGGQKQRVGIARALAASPALLLSDEATSALDPETTRAILTLLKDINRKLGLTILLITHEMEVVKRIADHVAVIDGGRIVERGTTFDIFSAPQHETTKVLLSGVPGMQLPDYVAARLTQEPTPSSASAGETVLRIVFTGTHATDPILSRLSTELGIEPNILGGAVDEITGRPFGTLVVSFAADAARLARVREFLAERGLSTEVLGHVA